MGSQSAFDAFNDPREPRVNNLFSGLPHDHNMLQQRTPSRPSPLSFGPLAFPEGRLPGSSDPRFVNSIPTASLSPAQGSQVTLDPFLGLGTHMASESPVILSTAHSAQENLQLSQVAAIREHCKALEIENERAKIRYSELSNSYQKLLDVVQQFPQSLSSLSSGPTAAEPSFIQTLTGMVSLTGVVELQEKNFPDVLWWDEEKYNRRWDEPGSYKAWQDQKEDYEKKTTMYLEDQNGRQLGSLQRSRIYKHAAALWTGMTETDKKVPNQYSLCNLKTLAAFRQEMEREFPILKLCDGHWKADEVWIRNYGQWFDKQPVPSDGTNQVKFEDGDDSSQPTALGKRKRSSAPAISAPSKQSRSSTPATISYDNAPSSADLAPSDDRTTIVTVAKVNNPLLNMKGMRLDPRAFDAATSASTAPPLAPAIFIEHPAALELDEHRKATPELPSESRASTTLPNSDTNVSYVAPIPNLLTHNDSDLGIPVPLATAPGSAPCVADKMITEDADAPARQTKTPPNKMSAGDKVFKATSGNTARAICGRKWKGDHPNGLAREFNAYWGNLGDDDKKAFEDEQKKSRKGPRGSKPPRATPV